MSHSIIVTAGWNLISPDDMASGTPSKAINDNFIALATIINSTGQLLANLDANTHKIVNLVDPASAQDAATKNYADEKLAKASNLSDVASASTARTNLGLGSAALLTAGVAANNAVQLNSSAQLPAVDGSLLTGISGGVPYSGATGPVDLNGQTLSNVAGILIGHVAGINADGSGALAGNAINWDTSGNLTAASFIANSTTTPASPVAGQIYFDGTHFQGWNGSAWKQLDN